MTRTNTEIVHTNETRLALVSLANSVPANFGIIWNPEPITNIDTEP